MATGIYRSADAAERAARAARQGTVRVGGNAPRAGVAYGGMPTGQLPRTSSLMSTGYGRGGITETGSAGRALGTAATSRFFDFSPYGRRDRSVQPTVTPTTGMGGGDGDGAGDSGNLGVPSEPQANPITERLLSELRRLRGEEETRIGTAEQALLGSLSATDPMAAYQWQTANVGIPQATLANYVQAVGGSPAEVAATQQLGQELLQGFLGDVGQYSQSVGTAAQNYRAAQQNVAKQNAEIARRNLGLAALAAELGIQSGEAQRQQQMRDTALELALKYGRMGSGGTLTAPSLPFNQVTIPGYGSISLPNTLL